jgi:hypothetical protein
VFHFILEALHSSWFFNSSCQLSSLPEFIWQLIFPGKNSFVSAIATAQSVHKE